MVPKISTLALILVAGMTTSFSRAQSGTALGTVATTTSTSTSTANSGTSVNAAMNDARQNNTWGTVANVAGGGLHAVTAYQNWALCGSSVGFCACCVIAAANTVMAISSMSQAGRHGSSNQNLMPELCKTASGVCNPNQFQWPDFNSCPSGDATCYSNVITNSHNPDLNSVFSGGGVSTGPGTSTSTAFSDYNKMLESMKAAGGSYNPKTGAVTFQGKTVSPNDLSNLSNLQKALGLSDSDMAKLKATNSKVEGAIAKLNSDPTIQSAIAGAAVNAAMGGAGLGGIGSKSSSGATGLGSEAESVAGLGLDTLGGTEGAGVASGANGDDSDPSGNGKKGGARSMKDRMSRIPASVAGKKRMFNGEPIGVSGDSIFDMMTRRYQAKTQQNSFIEQLLVAPK